MNTEPRAPRYVCQGCYAPYVPPFADPKAYCSVLWCSRPCEVRDARERKVRATEEHYRREEAKAKGAALAKAPCTGCGEPHEFHERPHSCACDGCEDGKCATERRISRLLAGEYGPPAEHRCIRCGRVFGAREWNTCLECHDEEREAGVRNAFVQKFIEWAKKECGR